MTTITITNDEFAALLADARAQAAFRIEVAEATIAIAKRRGMTRADVAECYRTLAMWAKFDGAADEPDTPKQEPTT